MPRLLAAGANWERVEIVQMVHEAGKDRMFSLVNDLDLLRERVLAVSNVKMIQIDPITAYLGVKQMDSFRTTDVRAVLGPVTDLAGELMVSIIEIMHFNKKPMSPTHCFASRTAWRSCHCAPCVCGR